MFRGSNLKGGNLLHQMVTKALEDKLSLSELQAKLPKLAKCFINQGCDMDDYENVSIEMGVRPI